MTSASLESKGRARLQQARVNHVLVNAWQLALSRKTIALLSSLRSAHGTSLTHQESETRGGKPPCWSASVHSIDGELRESISRETIRALLQLRHGTLLRATSHAPKQRNSLDPGQLHLFPAVAQTSGIFSTKKVDAALRACKGRHSIASAHPNPCILWRCLPSSTASITQATLASRAASHETKQPFNNVSKRRSSTCGLHYLSWCVGVSGVHRLWPRSGS